MFKRTRHGLFFLLGFLCIPSLQAGWFFSGDEGSNQITSVKGVLVNDRYVIASPQVGRLLGVHVAIGESVNAGQAVAELDSVIPRYELEVARAELAHIEAKKVLVLAELDHREREADAHGLQLKRAKEQRKRIAVTQDELARTTARYHSAKAALDAAAARVAEVSAAEKLAIARTDLAEQRIQSAVLRTPVDGVVAAVVARRGEVISSGGRVMMIRLRTEFHVQVSIAPGLAAQLMPGAEVRVSVADGAVYAGIVSSTEFGLGGNVEEGLDGDAARVTVSISASDSALSPGEPVEVHLRASEDVKWPPHLPLN